MYESMNSIPGWSYTPLKRCLLSDDPFFEEGELLCNISRKQLDNSEDVEHLVQRTDFKCDSCGEWFSSVPSYEAHYNSLHRHTCLKCQRSFPSTHLLEIHVLENHDALFSMIATRKNLYRCLVESCPDRFSSDKERKDHLVSFHKYPADFRFNRPSRQQRKKKTPSSPSSEEPMETSSASQEKEPSSASPNPKQRQIFELLPDFRGQFVLVEDQPGLSKEIFPRKVRKRPKVIIKKMEQRAILLRTTRHLLG
ncbi:zinc finger protein 511-like isoform X2 [Porites lutea]|uniref:zinc finger protein 511-like isoform X2 n=2 Tax=Porites lutea TaxID=51062 RepID=UPI003CC5A8A8